MADEPEIKEGEEQTYEACVTFFIKAKSQEEATRILNECVFVDSDNHEAVDFIVSGEPMIM